MKSFPIPILITFLTILSLSKHSFAKVMSRPQSTGSENLIEVTVGQIEIEKQQFLEVSIEYEYFIPSSNHHFSIGLSSEIEFKNRDEYFLGPMVSLYFFHMKLLYTSGLQTSFDGNNYWKNRIGLGYEYYIKEHIIIVPTIAADFIEGKTHRSLGIGLAKEF